MKAIFKLISKKITRMLLLRLAHAWFENLAPVFQCKTTASLCTTGFDGALTGMFDTMRETGEGREKKKKP